MEKSSIEGHIQGFTLPSFLQVLQVDQKTCTLKIQAQGSVGYLYFRNGEFLDAETGRVKGVDAALEIVSWEKAEIEIIGTCKKNGNSIGLSLIEILMEAFMRKDKKKYPEPPAIMEWELSEGPDSPDMNENSTTIDETGKEIGMNVKKLKEAIEVQKQNLGDGLLATDIYASADGQSLIGYNSNPQACALFNRITEMLGTALKDSNFPRLSGYYILNLDGGHMVVVLPMGEYQWGMLIDTNKTKLGLLLNVAIPKMMTSFEEARRGA